MPGYVRGPYTERPFLHEQAKHIASLMEEKKSNICLAADVKSMSELIRIADLVGKDIVLLKTHADTYADFSFENVKRLQELSQKHQFVIFEDRKFCDIGNTVHMQYTGGIFRIAEWAPVTNAIIAPGNGVLDGLRKGMLETAKTIPHVAHNALLLLAEMSSKDNTFKRFLKESLSAAAEYRQFVIGFISQRSFGDPSFFYMTPGVSAVKKGDDVGQVYRTPEDVIKDSNSDILIIGRGIYEAEDPAKAALEYKEAGWKAHQAMLGTSIQIPNDIQELMKDPKDLEKPPILESIQTSGHASTGAH